MEDNRSEESILPLQGTAITKTTVVTVDREVGVVINGNERMNRGLWGKGSVKELALERRVEDRV